MSAQDHAEQTAKDHPVQAQEVLDLPDEGIEEPTDPSDQPPLPDFNS